LLANHIKILEFSAIINKFKEIKDLLEVITLENELEYIKSNSFITETQIISEECSFKNGIQILKPKPSSKWHDFAWEILR